MKHKKIFGIFGMALILSLLLAIAPATPAFGATISLTASSGKVGDSVTVIGTSFTAGTQVGIYFSNQAAAAGGLIGTSVTVYQFIIGVTVGTSTSFTQAFTVPSTMSVGGNVAVTSGSYYLYVVYFGVGSDNLIQIVYPFTVIGNPTITLSPTTGAGGSSVTISGSNFTPSTLLVFKFDTTTVTPTSGQTASLSTGAFVSAITIPSANAGSHTISVTAGTSTASASFTITVTATLDALSPTSGSPGTDVVISGSDFPVSTPLVFKFETTVLTPKTNTDTATRASGIFLSTVTIPANASAGAHTITVTAGTISKTATFTVITAAIPSIDTLSPTSGLAGTDVTVSGSHFPAGTALVFKFDDTAVTPKSGDSVSQSSGSFSSVITIPSGAAAGPHAIYVTAGTGTDNKPFTVTAPATSLKVSVNGTNVGALVVIVGNGFQAGGKATITFGGVQVTQGDIDSTGSLFVNFQIPAGKHGAIPVVVSDGVNTSTVTVTVEATAPSIPQPLEPGMGASLKAPYLFKWDPVTDPSIPVTYDLQIATSSDFAAGNIVIDKTGLTQPEYTLTDAEALRIPSNGTTYFWHERAVDAAANVSGWSGAGQFTVTAPFKFVGWPLYVTMAVGALVFFLFGLWVGRRTAFYY